MTDAWKARTTELMDIFGDTPMTVQGCITRPESRTKQLYHQAYSIARLKEYPKWKPSAVSESAINMTRDIADEFANYDRKQSIK